MTETKETFEYRWRISRQARDKIISKQKKFERETGGSISLEKIVSNLLEKIKI